jgi:hypothetical protein
MREALSYSARSCPVRPMLSDFPAWTHTLDSMIEQVSDGFQVKASCTVCGGWRRLDRVALERLREKVGGGFSLVNKRCACRLRPGCPGKNRFHYQSGVMRPLWDDHALAWWMGRQPVPGRR